MSRRRSIEPCGIDDSDLEALRADDASFYGQDCAVSDTDSDHETARAAKRVDRSGEDNDEISATLIFLSILGLEPQPIRASCCSRQNSNTLDHRLRLHHEPLPAVWRGPAGVAFL